MSRREGQVTDEYGRPVSGANVYVFDGAGNNAVLTSDGTAPLAQPVITDELGVYVYHAADAYYREDTYFGGKLRYKELIGVGTAFQNLLDIQTATQANATAAAQSATNAAGHSTTAAAHASNADVDAANAATSASNAAASALAAEVLAGQAAGGYFYDSRGARYKYGVVDGAVVAVVAPHVHVDSVNGSDSNDGASQTTAFKTIAKAQSVIAAGQTLGFTRGSYWREQFKL
ncbi:MAG TPA: hypothetical protein VGW38_19445, partial [Chloroflexota bacterium]|nr:hypothetical protein [Chloroflexota bacterium]